MYNPAHGLPGKNVKVTNLKATGNKAPSNPLGITVDTNVFAPGKPPPEQVYPPKNEGHKISSAAVTGSSSSKKKKITPPKPLNLYPTSYNHQLQTKTQAGLSPQDAVTPIIVITPTQDLQPTNETTEAPPVRRPRIVSSVYSPIARHSTSGKWRLYTPSLYPSKGNKATPPSVYGSTFKSRDAARRLSLSSVLPTPKRSSGWWNVITSPFLNRQSTNTSHQSSHGSNSDMESSPFRALATPIGVTRTVDIDATDSTTNQFSPSELENSYFRNFVPPESGEAASFYDPNNDFSTPKLQPSAFQSPQMPASALTNESDSFGRDSDEREVSILSSRENPEVHDSAKKVPKPQLPRSTPPKSSIAPVIEDFRANVPTQNASRDVYHPASHQEPLSPLSPSPIVETASIATVQLVRSIDSEATNSAKEKPKLRLITNNSKVTPQQDRLSYASDSTSPGYSAESSSANASLHIMSTKRAATADGEAALNAANAGNTRSMHQNGYPSQPSQDKSEVPPPLPPPVRNASDFAAPPAHRLAKQSERVVKDPERDGRWDAERVGRRTKSRHGKLEKWFLIGVGGLLAILVLLAIILCMTVTTNMSGIPVEQHWLNLTGYPPLPTGVSTLNQLQNTVSITGCVAPPEMWSCEVPREQRPPGGDGQPKFRMLVLFNNQSTIDPSLLQPSKTVSQSDDSSFGTYTTKLLKRSLFRKRSEIPPFLLDAYPSPPSYQDQTFLGNTTDAISHPYAGEVTPFSISFLSTSAPAGQSHSKRSTNAAGTIPSLIGDIPAPALGSNGVSAASPELHPYPQSQPLLLFNRGQDTEHYGFYTYFDKSIFLASTSSESSNSESSDFAAVNSNGGARIQDAIARCTWSQTRFLVQIWTRQGTPATSPAISLDAHDLHILGGVNGTLSAFDFSGSGTFPWPVTITLDRHGGDAEEKALYCYGIDSANNIDSQQKAVHEEDRAYGGKLVNPAPGPFADVTLAFDEGGWGGIDGGTGGCMCQWTNFGST